MANRRKHHNLYLGSDEEGMLRELCSAQGLDAMQMVRHLIWVEHHRMRAHLAKNELPADSLLRLDVNGNYNHREVFNFDRRKVIRNVEGAFLLDAHSSFLLRRVAQRAKIKPEKVLSDLIDDVVKGTDLEPPL